MSWRVIEGDCIEVMAAMDEASVDAIVTDPPYGIGFMGHEWDQAGKFGAVRANGEPGLDERVTSRRRRQPSAASGAGHARERARLGGPTGKDNTSHTLRGGAMHAGRYDLSPSANAVYQAWCEAWAREALRALKPGGHLLCSGSTRTYHRLASGLEDAGFEIRDCIAWLFGSGFPKSKNLEGEWDGWSTALKPAFEPIVVARKPLIGTVAANVAEHRTGALNIDAARIDWQSAGDEAEAKNKNRHADFDSGPRDNQVFGTDARPRGEHGNYDATGRWPANVVLDEEAGALLDDQAGERQAGAVPSARGRSTFSARGHTLGDRIPLEAGGASRFFYCPKADRQEREIGKPLGAEVSTLNWSSGDQSPGTFQAEGTNRTAWNHHPTVKPIALMQWLVRLVTPGGGIVVDPFTGSGTTGIAALREGFNFIGIEREPAYVEIARARIAGDAPLFNPQAEVVA